MTKHCPAWLFWDEGRWGVKPRAQATLEYIFERTIDGCGKQRLLGELVERFAPWDGGRVERYAYQFHPHPAHAGGDGFPAEKQGAGLRTHPWVLPCNGR